VAKLVDPQHEWAGEIGRVVIAFGSIEHVTMLCLRQLPRDSISSATRHFNLGPRLEQVLAILGGSADPDAQALSELFRTAKKLADDRNAIVHNPLMLEVYEDGDGGHEFKQAIYLMRKAEKSMSFENLVDVREKAERLATDLYRVAAPILERCYRARHEDEGADA
jgi:hypothetical protein